MMDGVSQSSTRSSVSPNPPLFDFEMRQTSTSPPPAPPYNPMQQSVAVSSGGKSDGEEVVESTTATPPYNTILSSESEELADSKPPPAYSAVKEPTVLKESSDSSSEKEKYENLKQELRQKFAEVTDEYKQLEDKLRSENRTLEEKMRSETHQWEEKDLELKKVHKMLDLQSQLMQEQLESVRTREEEVKNKEEQLATTKGDFESRESALSEIEQKHSERERAVQCREVTVARLAKQNDGLMRLKKASTREISTETDQQPPPLPPQPLSKPGRSTATQTAPDVKNQTTSMDENILMEQTTSLHSSISLRKLQQLAEEAQGKSEHATAMWTTIKRKEGMLKEWEATLRGKESAVAEAEKRIAESTKVIQDINELSEVLVKAANAAESKLLDELDERLSRRLHHRERKVLMRDTSLASPQAIADQISALEAWEHELESIRTSLHQNSLQVKRILSNIIPNIITTTPPCSEDELRARETAMRDKETRWSTFLRREIEHRSLEAQRFDVLERLKDVCTKEEEMSSLQVRLNEEMVAVSSREVAVRRIEDEAARVLSRMDKISGMRIEIEKRESLTVEAEASNRQRTLHLEREFDRLRQRHELLREKEKSFEKRVEIELDLVRKSGHHHVRRSESSSLIPCHSVSPDPTLPQPDQLESAVLSITSMLDNYVKEKSVGKQ